MADLVDELGLQLDDDKKSKDPLADLQLQVGDDDPLADLELQVEAPGPTMGDRLQAGVQNVKDLLGVDRMRILPQMAQEPVSGMQEGVASAKAVLNEQEAFQLGAARDLISRIDSETPPTMREFDELSRNLPEHVRHHVTEAIGAWDNKEKRQQIVQLMNAEIAEAQKQATIGRDVASSYRQDFIERTPEDVTFLEQAALSMARSIGPSAVAAAISGVSPAAGVALGASTMGAFTLGQSYLDAERIAAERGQELTHEHKMRFASLDALFETVGEAASLRVALKSGLPLFDRLVKAIFAESSSEAVTAMAQKANEFLQINPEMTLKDFAYEVALSATAGAMGGAGMAGVAHGAQKMGEVVGDDARLRQAIEDLIRSENPQLETPEEAALRGMEPTGEGQPLATPDDQFKAALRRDAEGAIAAVQQLRTAPPEQQGRELRPGVLAKQMFDAGEIDERRYNEFRKLLGRQIATEVAQQAAVEAGGMESEAQRLEQELQQYADAVEDYKPSEQELGDLDFARQLMTEMKTLADTGTVGYSVIEELVINRLVQRNTPLMSGLYHMFTQQRDLSVSEFHDYEQFRATGMLGPATYVLAAAQRAASGRYPFAHGISTHEHVGKGSGQLWLQKDGTEADYESLPNMGRGRAMARMQNRDRAMAAINTLENWIKRIAPDFRISIVDRESAKLYYPKLDSQTGGYAMTTGAGEGIIFVDDVQDEQQFVEVMAHEFGHLIGSYLYQRMPKHVKDAVDKSWATSTHKLQKTLVSDALRQRRGPHGIGYSGIHMGTVEDNWNNPYIRGYIMGREEWVAHNLERMLAGDTMDLQKDALPFFKKLKAALERFFKIFGKEFAPEKTFEDFIKLGALRERQRSIQRSALTQVEEMLKDFGVQELTAAESMSIDNFLRETFKNLKAPVNLQDEMMSASPLMKQKAVAAIKNLGQVETAMFTPEAPHQPLRAVRRGEISPEGAYFSTEGRSTYFDPEGGAQEFDIGAARVADTSSDKVAIELLRETLKDKRLSSQERQRLQEALQAAEQGEPFIDYMLADETPMAEAGKRLGYDGFKVWENDDVGGPTSVFIWNVDKVKPWGQQPEGPIVNISASAWVTSLEDAHLPGQGTNVIQQSLMARPDQLSANNQGLPRSRAASRMASAFKNWLHYRKSPAPEGGYDKYNWAMKQIFSLEQWAQVNPHIESLQRYLRFVREWAADKTAWLSRADSRLRAWRRLTVSEQKTLARFMIDQTLEGKFFNLQDPQVQQKYPMTPRAREMYEQVNSDFQEFISAVEATLVAQASRRLVADPFNAAKEISRIRERFKGLRDKPYFPLSRFGEYIISVKAKQVTKVNGRIYNPGEVIHFEAFDTQAAQLAEVDRIKGKYPNGEIKLDQVSQDVASLMGMPIPLIEALKNNPDIGLNDDQKKAVDEYLYKIAPGQSFVKHMIQRKGIEGYSEDAMRSYANYFFHGANHLARIKYAERLSEEVKATQLSADAMEGSAVKRRAIANYMARHFKYIMQPENDLAGLRATGTILILGASLKTAFINSTQVGLVTYPHLAAKFGDFKALRELRKAYGDAAAMYHVSKQLTKAEEAAITKWSQGLPLQPQEEKIVKQWSKLDREERDMLRLAVQQGWIDESFAMELAAMSEGSWLTRFKSSNQMGYYARTLAHYSMMPFQMVEKLNRRVTAIAAFRLAKQSGGNFEQALEAAREAVSKTQYEYSKWNRAELLRGKKGIIFMFWQYSLNTLFFAMGGDKGWWRWWLIMAAAAGLSGLPFAKNFMDIATWVGQKLVGPDERFNAHYKVKAAAKEFGEMLGVNPDFLLHGLSRFGFGIPLLGDLSGSLSMGDILPGTQVLGRAGQRWESAVTESLSDVGGAGVSLAMRFLQALTSDDPDLLRRMEKGLIPATFAQKAIGAYRAYANGALETATGADILKFDRQDPWDLATIGMMAGGFRPGEAAAKQEEHFLWQDYKRFYMARRQMLYTQLDREMEHGDNQSVGEVIDAIRKFNKQVPSGALAITPQQIRQMRINRLRGRALQEGDQDPQKMFQGLRQQFSEGEL